MSRSKNKKNKRNKPAPRPRMRVRDAMDLVPDDLPDGAYFAMLSEVSGVDYGDLASELIAEEEGSADELDD
jgi:hypothetical protein